MYWYGYIFKWRGAKNIGAVTTLDEQLSNLSLKDKKLYIKMDIEGGEFSAIDQIIEKEKFITGINIELHLWFNNSSIDQAKDLLTKLQKNFLLIHIHGNNSARTLKLENVKGMMPSVFELTFINKNLVSKYEVSDNQKHPTDVDQPCTSLFEEAEFEILAEPTNLLGPM
jgi:hypothetical protein